MSDIIPTGWSIVGIGDFNGDGISDILLRSYDGTVTDWLGQTNGNFNENSNVLQTSVSDNWHTVGTGDFNGEGRSDLLWRADDGALTDWLGQLGGGLTDNSSNFIVNVGSIWHIVGTGDFNGDGLDDILWRADDGAVTDWLGQANGGFNTDNSTNFISAVSSDWHIAGTGDFNGDGRTDILWRNDIGTINDWLATASGGFSANADPRTSPNVPLQWSVAGIDDFNGDHYADILWRNSDGTITDWLGQANGGFTDNSAIASQPVSLDLQIAGVGDFNGDGRSDVLFRGTDGTLETWVGAADGGILSPMEKLWQDALANVSQFFDEMANSLESYSPQSSFSDQNSYSVYNPMDDVFNSMLSWTPVVQAHPTTPISDILALNLNPDFQVMSITETALAAAFNVNFGSMTLLDAATSAYEFNMNGIGLQGTWHDGTRPLADSNPIFVTATLSPTYTGYFVFDAAASGYHFSDGHGSGAPTYVTPSPDWSIHNPAVQSALAIGHADEGGVIRAIAAWATIVAAALNAHIDPALLAAIALRETDFRNIDQPDGLGRGWFQIDLGAHPEVTSAQAHDLTFAANYAANILATNMATLAREFPNFTPDQMLQATAASYNFGTGNISGNPFTIDQGTTENNYGSNVLNIAKAFVDPSTGRIPGT